MTEIVLVVHDRIHLFIIAWVSMRSLFKGHFKHDEEKIQNIWENSFFVFDTNVLLNLYRYSEDTRNDYLRLLGQLGAKIWLPEQVAFEFLNNRASVIIEQMNTYKSTQKEIEHLLNSFSKYRGHPFISKETKKQLEKAVKSVDIELSTNFDRQESLITDDPIKDKLANLFDGRVGDRYTEDHLNNLIKLGAERYESKTPPGYRDGNKIKEPKLLGDKRRIFGDWIAWKQTIDFACSKKSSLVLVTDDKKEDWWEEHNGKTIGPRPELISEFFAETGYDILIYRSDSFLNYSSNYLKFKVNKDSIDEVIAEKKRKKTELNTSVTSLSSQTGFGLTFSKSDLIHDHSELLEKIAQIASLNVPNVNISKNYNNELQQNSEEELLDELRVLDLRLDFIHEKTKELSNNFLSYLENNELEKALRCNNELSKLTNEHEYSKNKLLSVTKDYYERLSKRN